MFVLLFRFSKSFSWIQ